MNNHLNEAQLFALLDAPANAACDIHLATCATCRNEFKQLNASLGNFRATATHFADAHLPAHLPSRLLQADRQPRTRLFTLPRAAWTTGLVAAMALGTASLTMLHKAPTQPVVNTASAPAAIPSQTASTATTDDALLEDIDRDLSTSVPPSLAPLETTTTTSGEKTTTSN